MQIWRRFVGLELMYEKLNVLEIGGLVGIVLAVIDVLFQLALVM